MKKRTVYVILGILLLAGASYCGVKIYQSTYAPKDVKTEEVSSEESSVPEPEPEPEPELEPSEPEPESSEPESEPEKEPEPEPYVSPIDFKELQELNSDIYAWIKIKDTNVDFPVLQSPNNDAFYLDHNSDGKYSANGSIFSEHEYNRTDFTDPVTILYGHNQWDGSMFGKLQVTFSDEKFWKKRQVIQIYTPDALLEYEVFAAVPYSNEHILYYHNFWDQEVFTGFFAEIMNTRDLSARVKEKYAPGPEDKVLILSTCLNGNDRNRFLVMGKLKTPTDHDNK